MKRFLLFLLLLGVYPLAHLQTATVNGHVSFSKDSINVVDIRLIENGVMKYGATADSIGNFSIQHVPYGKYELNINGGLLEHDGNGFTGTTYISLAPSVKINPLVVDSVSPTFIEIHYPGICEYDKEENRKGICPEGHQDNIIPIVYGYPSRKAINSSKAGKIILGGCIVSSCDPHWYCKKHDKRF